MTASARALREVAEIIAGQSPPGSTYNEQGEGLPFFQGKAEFGELFPTPRKWCTQPTKIAEPSDILISIRAPVGPTNLVSERCCIGRGLAAIRPRNEVVGRDFLRFFFLWVEPVLAARGQGSTFPAISRSDLASLRVPLVPIDEQRRIVDILTRAEGIVRLRRQAIKLIQETIPALFNEMFGTLQATSVHPLRDIAEVVSGVAKGRRFNGRRTVMVPYLRVANVQAGRLDLTEIKKIEALPEEVKELALQRADVLLTEGGDADKLGRGALWDADIPDCIHQNHVFRVRTHQSILLPIYFATYLQTQTARDYFLRSAKRTTNLASINMTQLRALPVPIPPLGLQEQFDREHRSVQSIIGQTEAAAKKATELFQSLLHRAFRGEL